MPAIERIKPRILTRDWGEEIIVAETPQYLGKILKMKAGTAGGLQYHVEKMETFYLHEGEAWVDTNANDTFGPGLCAFLMRPGESFHIPPGAVHRVRAITDCIFFEASTPHHNDRVRVEAQYGEPDTGGLPSTR